MNKSLPFEIINGDNLDFISDAYDKCFIIENDWEMLIISIVGPQSSGKSFIMNYLFGTLF